MPLLEKTAFFFVYHGSRDSRPKASVQDLSRRSMRLLSMRLQLENCAIASFAGQSSSPLVEQDGPVMIEGGLLYGVRALELAAIPLHQQLVQFGQRAADRGITEILVIPLFLLAGTHVREDIPEEVSLAQQLLGQFVHVNLSHHIGSHPEMGACLQRQWLDQSLKASQSARILVSHGSKNDEANRPVEAIAAQLGAISAYWSIPPGLEMCLDALIQHGCTEVTVIPYFLFEGKTTDAIARIVQTYRDTYPLTDIHIGNPIGQRNPGQGGEDNDDERRDHDVAIVPLIVDLIIVHAKQSRTLLV